MTLENLYQKKLNNFKQTGIKDDPEKLLAMLLLPERDQYEPLLVGEGEFYKRYKKNIDCKISQIEKDFNFTHEEIVQLIESKGVSADDYEHDKIWFVFCEGFGAMHWGLMYHRDWSPEQIYLTYFEED